MKRTEYFTALLSINLACLAGAANLHAAEAVRWRTNLDAAKIEAAQTGRLVLLHFYTSSCGPCKMLDQNVFSQPQIGEGIEQNYVPVKVNADESPALASAYQITRVPSEIVIGSQGNAIAKLSCPQNPSEYIGQLSNLAENYRMHRANQNTIAQPPVQAAYAGLQVGNLQNQPAPAANGVPNNQVAPASRPAEINNSYASRPSGPAPYQSQAVNNSLARPPQRAMTPTLPANAMPNSYQSQANPNGAASTSLPGTGPQTVQNNQFAQPHITGQTTVGPGREVTRTSHQSVVKQLPPGCPPLAFDGFCPVSLRESHKWVEGNLEFGAIHRGRTFLFATDAQRQQFLANPDSYCPVFSGMDPVMLLDQNKVVEGSRKFGFEYRGAFYLFSNAATMNQFKNEPDKYAAGVRQAMARMEMSAGGTTMK